MEYGRYVVQRCHHHWTHTPTIHAASHIDHQKRVAWFSISMHACGSVPIDMGTTWQPFGPPELCNEWLLEPQVAQARDERK